MDQKVFKRRVYMTGLLLLSIACFFIFKFISLHFSDRIQISSEEETETRRGLIRDSEGHILAVSIERLSLFADPEEIADHEGSAKRLSPVIGLSQKFILERMKRNKRFVWLKRKIDDETAEAVKRLGITGLHFKKEYHRVYPHDRLASNIIGFVDIDNNGLDGIEYRYNKILSGNKKTGIFSREIASENRSIITLTIDRFIQHICENEIGKGVKEFNAEIGVAVVLEVATGRILSIAKYPYYNPNYYWDFTDDERGNFSVVNSFEPGSTLKIMALAALLEYVPSVNKKSFYCGGSIEIADAVIQCGKEHGYVSLSEIIKYSCNVGIIEAVKELDKNSFYEVLKKFGFGSKTGIELPGESDGILRPIKDWSGLSKYSIAIGQEISVNSIQLVSAFGALANGGVYMIPTIIESIENSEGTVIQEFFPRTRGKIMSAGISSEVLKYMSRVVTGGTGEKAGLEYYNAGGKTGTAQKSMSRGGYYSDKYIASFIGIAPIERPDICILVVIDEPRGITSGGDIAAPIFARIANRVLPYRGAKVKMIAAVDPVRINSSSKSDNGGVPDFHGLLMSDSLKQLLKIQKSSKIKYFFIGSGRVYKQSPPPGNVISPNTQIVLYLREE